jgi:hypothetical protein
VRRFNNHEMSEPIDNSSGQVFHRSPLATKFVLTFM